MLNQKQRETFAEKILDIANIAVGALIFGQFVAGTKFNYYITILAVAIFVICFVISYILLKEKK